MPYYSKLEEICQFILLKKHSFFTFVSPRLAKANNGRPRSPVAIYFLEKINLPLAAGTQSLPFTV